MAGARRLDLLVALKFTGVAAANRLYQQACLLLVLIFTAQALGPVGRGDIAATMAWAQLVATCSHLSFGQVAYHQGLKSETRYWLSESLPILVFGNLLASSLLMISAVWIAVAGKALEFTGLSVSSMLLGAVLVPTLIWENQALYLTTKMGALTRFNYALNVGRSISLLLVVAQAALGTIDSIGAIGAFVAGQLLSSGLLLKEVHGWNGNPFRFSFGALRRYMESALRLHPLALAVVVVGTNDLLYLQTTRGAAEAGVYQAGAALIAILVTFSQATQHASYQWSASPDHDAAWRMQLRVLGVVLLAFLVAAAVFWLVAQHAVTALLGAQFLAAATVAKALIPIGLAQVLSNLLTPQWVARGYFWQASAGMTIIAIVAVSANSVLIPLHGISGAITTSWIVAGVWIVMNVGFAVWITLQRSSPAERHQ